MAKNPVFTNDSSGEVEFNMTPMIDCTFLLIIFFILSATVLNDALAELELHRPYESKARKEETNEDVSNCIIVNVVSMAKDKDDVDSAVSSMAKNYMINGDTIDVGEREMLIERIKMGAMAAREADFKEFYVEIRADHRVNFGAVRDVLKASAAASVPRINMKMNITALTNKK